MSPVLPQGGKPQAGAGDERTVPAPGLLQPERERLSRCSWDTGGQRDVTGHSPPAWAPGTAIPHHCHAYGGCQGTSAEAMGAAPTGEALPQEGFQELMSFSAQKSARLTLPVWDLQPPGSAAGAQQSSPDRLLGTQKPQLHSQHA